MHKTSMLLMQKFVQDYVGVNNSVLDVGSYNVNGTYKGLFTNNNYVGIDIEPGPNVDIVAVDPYKWKIESDSFDVVISGQALEHIEFFWLTFSEMVRVLKTNGFLCLIVPAHFQEHRYPVDCYRFLTDGMVALARYTDLSNLQAFVEGKDAVLIAQKVRIADQLFSDAVNKKSDINEHLPIFAELGARKIVTELGVRTGISTIGWLYGGPKKMISIDIRNCNVDSIKKMAKEKNVDFTFIKKNCLDGEIHETDILFIDTFHTFSQLEAELNLYESKVRELILIHDTSTFGIKGQNGEEGMQRAISEFIAVKKNWELHKVYTNNNGLTILKKINIAR